MSDKATEKIQELEQSVIPIGEHIRKMDDFVSPDVLYKELIRCVRKYHPSTDISMIEKAFHIADDAHKGQVRKSGEAYIIHPLCVAIILAELELDKETIVAGLLHDVVEDTVMTSEQIAEEFGDEVALLVDGVTKLGQLSYDADKVEIQIRTIAMDFWASLEHKIYYKFEGNAPDYISRDLRECSDIVSMLDEKMLQLNKAILEEKAKMK